MIKEEDLEVTNYAVPKTFGFQHYSTIRHLPTGKMVEFIGMRPTERMSAFKLLEEIIEKHKDKND